MGLSVEDTSLFLKRWQPRLPVRTELDYFTPGGQEEAQAASPRPRPRPLSVLCPISTSKNVNFVDSFLCIGMWQTGGFEPWPSADLFIVIKHLALSYP